VAARVTAQLGHEVARQLDVVELGGRVGTLGEAGLRPRTPGPGGRLSVQPDLSTPTQPPLVVPPNDRSTDREGAEVVAGTGHPFGCGAGVRVEARSPTVDRSAGR
jgi:hypothetical protein